MIPIEKGKLRIEKLVNRFFPYISKVKNNYLRKNSFSMKNLFALMWYCFATASLHASSIYLYRSDFFRLNQGSFQIVSYFNMGSSPNTFQLQSRREFIQNDTLFMQIVFNTTFPVSALGCSRIDTIQQTLSAGGFEYINVSTGVITYNDTNSSVIDTLWHLFDSTFTSTLTYPELSFQNLILISDETKLIARNENDPVTQMILYNLNGQFIRKEDETEIYIEDLASGIYLLRIITNSGIILQRKWFK